jgi:hypothetical protein
MNNTDFNSFNEIIKYTDWAYDNLYLPAVILALGIISIGLIVLLVRNIKEIKKDEN